MSTGLTERTHATRPAVVICWVGGWWDELVGVTKGKNFQLGNRNYAYREQLGREWVGKKEGYKVL